MEEELTLEELSDRTGVEPRTLRSWVAEGLLAPPLRGGRGARYPAANAERALAVRALKEGHGLSLAEIGRRLMTASSDEIRAWAQEAVPAGPRAGSARAYIRALREQEGASARDPRAWAPGGAKPFRFAEPPYGKGAGRETWPGLGGPGDDADRANLERLVLELGRLVGGTAPRRSRGAVWTRIAVTPDLEIAVRGALDPRERLLFESLADHLRAVLTGRPLDD